MKVSSSVLESGGCAVGVVVQFALTHDCLVLSYNHVCVCFDRSALCFVAQQYAIDVVFLMLVVSWHNILMHVA